MNSKFEFAPESIVASFSATGEQQYISVDTQSGGYWYWSKSLFAAKRFSELELENISRYLDENIRQTANKICILQMKTRVIDQLSINEAEVSVKLKRLNELKKQATDLQSEIDLLKDN